MSLTPDWVIGSHESLDNVLSNDLPTWTAQVTMFNGAWIKKGTAPTDLVTLELSTFGKEDDLLEVESAIVDALKRLKATGIMTGENQRSKYGTARIAWIFYRMPKGKNDG